MISLEERVAQLEKQVQELDARTAGDIRLGPTVFEVDPAEIDRLVAEIQKQTADIPYGKILPKQED